MKKMWLYLAVGMAVLLGSCEKEKEDETCPGDGATYYEIGLRSYSDWRDSSFIVHTSNPALIEQADAQLALPVEQRTKLVLGTLARGNCGYNKNGSHYFKWHFLDNWELTDVTIEIYDGRPYSDIDLEHDYFMEKVKRYGAWGSYVKRKLPGRPE